MENTPPDISATLVEIKKILGTNYRKKIADRTEFSVTRVSQVFREENLNHVIIQTAIAMATEVKEKQATAKAQLEKL